MSLSWLRVRRDARRMNRTQVCHSASMRTQSNLASRRGQEPEIDAVSRNSITELKEKKKGKKNNAFGQKNESRGALEDQEIKAEIALARSLSLKKSTCARVRIILD